MSFVFELEVHGYVDSQNPEWGRTHFTKSYPTKQAALKAFRLAKKDANNVHARVYQGETTLREWYYCLPKK